jgi:hypothetical protein
METAEAARARSKSTPAMMSLRVWGGTLFASDYQMPGNKR